MRCPVIETQVVTAAATSSPLASVTRKHATFTTCAVCAIHGCGPSTPFSIHLNTSGIDHHVQPVALTADLLQPCSAADIKSLNTVPVHRPLPSMAIPVSHITAGAQGAALTRVRRVMPCSEHLLAHPQRQIGALHQRGVIRTPFAEAVRVSGSFVFHTLTLPDPASVTIYATKPIGGQSRCGGWRWLCSYPAILPSRYKLGGGFVHVWHVCQ